jgi:hypothetical protein
MSTSDEPWRPAVRVFVRIALPLILGLTFVSMEIALASKGPLSDFTSGLRWFIFTTLFAPFFLGVLLGHWYHPIPRWYEIMNEKLYHGKQLAPPFILLTLGGLIMGVAWGIFGLERFAPSYLSFIMVFVGMLLGALIWPVRVFPPRR